MAYSFEQLPEAVTQLCADMALVKEMLLKAPQPKPETDQWFDIDELAAYTRLAKPTIYGRKDIPSHKQGKRLMYLKSEIDAWLKQGRRLTQADAAADADAFLSIKKKKGGLQ